MSGESKALAASRLPSLYDSFIRPNILILISIFSTGFGFLLVGWIFKLPIKLNVYFGWQAGAGSLTLVATFWGLCIYSLIKHRPEKPTRFIIERVLRGWRFPYYLARGFPVYALAAFSLSAFTSYKNSYHTIIPYYADPLLSHIDRVIHIVDPWRLLQPLIGYPVVSHLINIVYLLWFTCMFFTFVFAVFLVRDDRFRSQYLSTFFLGWAIVGGLVATLFASVGPCFYQEFYHDNYYAELMSYLNSANEKSTINSLDVQAMLLEKYKSGETGAAAGISAFPSMHVGIAVLNALFYNRVHRYAGYAAWAFAFLIFIGSIHLAWHYAVDGYAAGLLVYGIWWVTGKISDWLYKSSDNAFAVAGRSRVPSRGHMRLCGSVAFQSRR